MPRKKRTKQEMISANVGFFPKQLELGFKKTNRI